MYFAVDCKEFELMCMMYDVRMFCYFYSMTAIFELSNTDAIFASIYIEQRSE